jgi:type I restriction enzyme S subunit
LSIPPTKEEQTAIATILFDMDSEIISLETKRDKYKRVKTGMMKELLIGKIRLISSEEKLSQKETINIVKADFKESEKKRHSKQIDEAVIISFLINKFGTENEPLTRFQYTKFSYLIHRKYDHTTAEFQKFAAGPYDPKSRYGGPENIGKGNEYFEMVKNRNGFDAFVAKGNIQEALDYFNQWYGGTFDNWVEQFRNLKPWDLETLTTVDMAVYDLRRKNAEVSVKSIKDYLASIPKWKAKLGKPQFSDFNIQKAINESYKLFGE